VCVSERTRENTLYNDDPAIGLVTQHVVQLHGLDVHPIESSTEVFESKPRYLLLV